MHLNAYSKVCTYGPWSVRVWLNGHSWARRRLEDRHLGYQPLDNGFAAVDDGRVLQEVCDGLSAAAIERFVRRWLAVLPSPFTEADIDAGYRYELSILQPAPRPAVAVQPYAHAPGTVGAEDRKSVV